MSTTYYIKSFDIAGYTFHAETLCGPCTIEALIADGSAAPAARNMATADVLFQVSQYLGIDADDERTFDSDEFPKVIFHDQILEDDCCMNCGTEL